MYVYTLILLFIAMCAHTHTQSYQMSSAKARRLQAALEDGKASDMQAPPPRGAGRRRETQPRVAGRGIRLRHLPDVADERHASRRESGCTALVLHSMVVCIRAGTRNPPGREDRGLLVVRESPRPSKTRAGSGRAPGLPDAYRTKRAHWETPPEAHFFNFTMDSVAYSAGRENYLNV